VQHRCGNLEPPDFTKAGETAGRIDHENVEA
jgi:hypothetical protein